MWACGSPRAWPSWTRSSGSGACPVSTSSTIGLTPSPSAPPRPMPLENFFIAYRRQDRLPGEFVRQVTVPKLRENQVFRAYKVSKRFDEDISAAMGAFRFTLDGRRIAEARVAFGGMAAIGRDYQPLDDHRASAAYRATIARNLLFKALSETASGQTRATRIVGQREALAAAE